MSFIMVVKSYFNNPFFLDIIMTYTEQTQKWVPVKGATNNFKFLTCPYFLPKHLHLHRILPNRNVCRVSPSGHCPTVLVSPRGPLWVQRFDSRPGYYITVYSASDSKARRLKISAARSGRHPHTRLPQTSSRCWNNHACCRTASWLIARLEIACRRFFSVFADAPWTCLRIQWNCCRRLFFVFQTHRLWLGRCLGLCCFPDLGSGRKGLAWRFWDVVALAGFDRLQDCERFRYLSEETAVQ